MIRNKTIAAVVAAALIGVAASQAFAHGPGMQGQMTGPGMTDSDDQGGMPMMGYGMGPGMMGYGMPMMGNGMPMMGYGMGGYGMPMMGNGMMGYGMPMMNNGAMGYGMPMMGNGMMGYGMGGYGCPQASQANAARPDLKASDVQKMLETRLGWMQNPNLKVGKVAEKDKDTITAEIVTKDGSLVRGFEVDRHTGRMRAVK